MSRRAVWAREYGSFSVHAKSIVTTNTTEETANGVVVEALPNTLFRVKRDDTGEEILAYLAGKMRMHRIRVLVGDAVEMELDPYGGRARIVRRN